MRLHDDQTVNRQHRTPPQAFIEVHRLVNTTSLLLHSLGGLLPGFPSRHLEQMHTVLDIGCGPGCWTLELARAFPHLRITGVDTRGLMLAFARSTLRQHPLPTVDYLELPGFVGPYPFQDGSFDLISIQLMSTFLPAVAWPDVLSTCWRLLRPGGGIRLTERETLLTNAPACQELNRLEWRARHLAGYSVAPSNRHLGMLSELESVMKAAKFEDDASLVQMVNWSYGTPVYEGWKQDALLGTQEVQALMVQMGLATPHQLEALRRRQSLEMARPTFRAAFPIVTLWGRKP